MDCTRFSFTAQLGNGRSPVDETVPGPNSPITGETTIN